MKSYPAERSKDAAQTQVLRDEVLIGKIDTHVPACYEENNKYDDPQDQVKRHNVFPQAAHALNIANICFFKEFATKTLHLHEGNIHYGFSIDKWCFVEQNLSRRILERIHYPIAGEVIYAQVCSGAQEKGT